MAKVFKTVKKTNEVVLKATLTENRDGKLVLELSAKNKTKNHFNRILNKLSKHRHHSLLLLLQQTGGYEDNKTTVRYFVVQQGPDITGTGEEIERICKYPEIDQSMSLMVVQLTKPIRCFERAFPPDGLLLARTGQYLDAREFISVGIVTKMSYDHQNVLAVPYEHAGNKGFLLYDELRNSCVVPSTLFLPN